MYENGSASFCQKLDVHFYSNTRKASSCQRCPTCFYYCYPYFLLIRICSIKAHLLLLLLLLLLLVVIFQSSMSETVLRVSADTTAPYLSLQDAFHANSYPNEPRTSNHSKIEKRRRDKLNAYITEISALVPNCSPGSPKLDKLTVLKFALQHIKRYLNANAKYLSSVPKIFCEIDLDRLFEEAVDGFCMIVMKKCGRIAYASESVHQYLGYKRNDVLNKSFYDLIHPKDLLTFKKQIYTGNEIFCPQMRKENKSANKSLANPECESDCSHPSPEPSFSDSQEFIASRSFFCRLKCKLVPVEQFQYLEPINASQGCPENFLQTKYMEFYCTGVMQSNCNPILNGINEHSDLDSDSSDLSNDTGSSCLAFVARPMAPLYWKIAIMQNWNSSQDTILTAPFLICACILGLLPQDMIGNSYHNYVFEEDLQATLSFHRNAMRTTRSQKCNYRLKPKENKPISVFAEWCSFRNPWTKQIESFTIRHYIYRQTELYLLQKDTPSGFKTFENTQCLLAQLLTDSNKGSKSRHSITML
ncbi:Aryl hydrocarbon receptor nuclear translocator-like protein 1 [Trichinella sp. T6]|nr:Aryl hydrocarbon receptor nuclear translocator-like protein 1 [Trichinella sp. T6]